MITTLLSGVPVESGGSGGVLELELLQLAGQPERGLVVIDTTQPFNGVRINFGGAVTLLSELDVYGACVGP